MSQLALGAAANVSQRHISFIETGRSRPSPELVRHLGRVLEVPLRAQNAMLVAAGHAPGHPETDPGRLLDAMPAIRFIVDAHAPYMAVVVDRAWNVVAANRPASLFAVRTIEPGVAGDGLNLMRATFHPEGLRRFVSNWEVVAPVLLAGLDRDTARYPGDATLSGLAAEMRGLAGPGLRTDESVDDLLVPLRYEIDGHCFELFTTIATIDTARDVTVSELRIETFWPADERSDAAWRRFISDVG